jgi:hypothetical protein
MTGGDTQRALSAAATDPDRHVAPHKLGITGGVLQPVVFAGEVCPRPTQQQLYCPSPYEFPAPKQRLDMLEEGRYERARRWQL